MFSLKASIAFALVICCVSASAESNPMWKEYGESHKQFLEECLKANNFSPGEFREYAMKANTDDNPPENFLCTMKCVHEKDGVIKSDGTLDVDKIKNLPKVKQLQGQDLEDVIKCANEFGKVQTCADIQKLKQCIKKH